jgi:hypothetical protein
MVELVCVDPERVHEFWPYAKDLILSAILRTGLSEPTVIERDILSGHQLLWLAWDGAIQAAASTHLANNVCTVTACGGANLNEWLPLFAQIEQYAKNEGCRCVRIYGRKGWLRVLKGYEAKHVIIERRL